MNNIGPSAVTPEQAADQPLGTNAKSSPPPLQDAKRIARAERYLALSTARKWIGIRSRKLRPDIPFPGNFMRTHDCRYIRKEGSVGLHLNNGTAHYSGLVTCGSLWACPVCAVKIQEKRRHELDHLVSWAVTEGLTAVMVTLTFPHQSFHTLSDLIQKQRDAFKYFRRGSPYGKLKKSLGFEGLVRSLEVTHGQNGWHPHTHELWLVRSLPFDFKARLIELWERACERSGLLDFADNAQLHAFRLRSVDVREDCDTADYLAKQDSSRSWGITHEVAKARSKSGRLKGVHPHEFLVRGDTGDDDLFFEYVEAMKGSRQLFWSSKLKDRCGLNEVDDQELAIESDSLDDQLGRIDQDQWDFIRRRRGMVSKVLDQAERTGFKGVLSMLVFSGYVRPVFEPKPSLDDDTWLIIRRPLSYLPDQC